MTTSCLRCRVIRWRLIAKTFHAAGETLVQLQARLSKKNPDVEFSIRCGYLVASKDGWHFEILK